MAKAKYAYNMDYIPDKDVLDIVLDDVHYRPVWCPLKEVQE